MAGENNIEVASGNTLGGILLGGLSSVIDGAVLFGQLSVQQRFMEQFPEQFASNRQATVPDPATAEQRAAELRARQGITFGSALDSVKNASPLVMGAVGVGVLALVIAFK